MKWRAAKSLVVLREQINALSPNRSKISDGLLGDAAHSSRASDHNPTPAGIVCAIDITHDPAHGINSEALAESIRAAKDPRVKYVISNGRIFSGTGQGSTAWAWRKYTGSNPHNKHVHISVKAALADALDPWRLNLTVSASEAKKPVERPQNPVLSQGAKGPDVERLQKLLAAKGLKVNVDSDFGPKTKAAVKAFQRTAGLKSDGAVGPYTWDALA